MSARSLSQRCIVQRLLLLRKSSQTVTVIGRNRTARVISSPPNLYLSALPSIQFVKSLHLSSTNLKSHASVRPSKNKFGDVGASEKMSATKKGFKKDKIKSIGYNKNQGKQLRDEGGKLLSVSSQQDIPGIKLETDEDVTKVAEEIMTRAKTVDVMASSVPLQQVEDLILGLSDSGFTPSDTFSLLSSHPVFLLRQRHLLANIHLFLSHGLDLEQVKVILWQFPSVVKLSESQINDIADALRVGNFREKSLAKVIAGNPNIFALTKAAVCQRLTMLRELFTTSDVVTVVVNSPDVLTMDWEEIQVLFDYVFHDMNVTQKQMVYANLFSHSLQHVKRRHAFLVRAGLFDMSKRREGEKSPNARLDQIIDSSDETFCTKFGRFHVHEYQTFCKLYDKEKKAGSSSDSDSE